MISSNEAGSSGDTNAARILLVIICAITQIIYVLCTLSPNAALELQKEGQVKDRILGSIIRSKPLKQAVVLAHIVFGVLHGLLILTYPSPPRAMCPSSSFAKSSTPMVFTWNWTLAGVLLLAITAGLIRLEAYRNLGKNFTFSLRKPDGLIKTGIHGWVQHPSYTGLIPMTLAVVWLEFRFDGAAACFIPSDWLPLLLRVQPYLCPVFALVISSVFALRVQDEEKMLKAEFGKEWEEYHAKTARFIPGVF